MQRPIAQVPAIQRQQIERHEVRPLAPEHQVVEVAAAVRLQADDLTVQDGIATPNRTRELGAEIGP